ncbi:hypothetical protein ACQ86K_01140 [Mucilaginibacter sp. P19]|uniref:hypothetical protein n=1 Tax=Mucilaginibacter sp. P19 TaxID=3423947 RepID=UPI003D67D67D
MKLAENIDIDFDHELKFSPIPFKEVIQKDSYFIDILKAEYLQAPLCPKPYLYLREFITDKQWEKDRSENLSQARVVRHDSQPIAAPFVADTPLETKSKRLTEDFFDKVIAKTLDEKYYGRHILETTLVKDLKQLSDQLDVFKHYAIDHTDVTSYQGFAQATAKSLVKQLDKIADLRLRMAVLENILTADLHTEITVLTVVNKTTETEKNAIKKRFIILKAYADEILQDAKDQLLVLTQAGHMIEEEIPVKVKDSGHGYYDWPDRFFPLTSIITSLVIVPNRVILQRSSVCDRSYWKLNSYMRLKQLRPSP